MTAKTCYCYCSSSSSSSTIRLLHLAGPANELFFSYALSLVFFNLDSFCHIYGWRNHLLLGLFLDRQ
jgi:hypothetical protein